MTKKAKFTKTAPDSSRANVLLEQIDKKFELVLEGHVVLDKKIDDLANNSGEFRTETRLNFKTLTQDLADLDGRLVIFATRTENNFKVIREYLVRIDDAIQDLTNRLGRKADLEELAELKQRVAQVELVVKKIYGKNRN